MAKPGYRDLGQWFLDTGDDAIAAGLLCNLEALTGEAEQRRCGGYPIDRGIGDANADR
jgi:hypothetical protein